jgi:hypothetical protein
MPTEPQGPSPQRRLSPLGTVAGEQPAAKTARPASECPATPLVGVETEQPLTVWFSRAITNGIENPAEGLLPVSRRAMGWHGTDVIRRWTVLGPLRTAKRFRRTTDNREIP